VIVVNLVILRACKFHRQTKVIRVLLAALPKALELLYRRNISKFSSRLQKIEFRLRSGGVFELEYDGVADHRMFISWRVERIREAIKLAFSDTDTEAVVVPTGKGLFVATQAGSGGRQLSVTAAAAGETVAIRQARE